MLVFLAFLIGLSLTSAQPKDFGVMGETFAIGEEDFLKVIQKRLQNFKNSGDLHKHQQLLAQKAREKTLRPTPVSDLQKTTKPRSYTYDPSFVVPSDLKDHKGQVFAKAGTTINPLNQVSLSKPILFIDGDDETQIAWAKKQKNSAKWILVNGSPLELETHLQKPVYFDQHGFLTKKLGITQIPALVTQEEKALKIEEIYLSEGDLK